MIDKWLPDDTSRIDFSSVKITLAGIAEIAEEFGVARTTVSTSWADRRERTGFPEPVAVLNMGPVYDLAEVRRWYAAWTSSSSAHRPRGSRQQ